MAIDRATRWVYRAISPNKTAATKAVLNARHQACPMRITLVRTDNSKELTDRLFGFAGRQPTGTHEFHRKPDD